MKENYWDNYWGGFLCGVILCLAFQRLTGMSINDPTPEPTAEQTETRDEIPPAPPINYRDVAGEPKKMGIRITGSDGKILHESEATAMPPHWCDACQDSLSPLDPISRLGLPKHEFGVRYCMNPDCELFEKDIIFPMSSKLKKQLETPSAK